MTHEEKNIGGGAELPDSDEQKLSRLLSGLKRVEVPKDFDFHLKARIARGRPEEVRAGSLFPILKYTIPLALFLVAGVGLMLQTFWNSGVDPSAVTQPQHPEPAPATTQDRPVLAEQTGNTRESSNTVAAVSNPPVQPEDRAPVRNEAPREPRRLDARPGGGSRTMGGGDPLSRDLRPKEFRVSNANVQSISNSAQSLKTESVRDALQTMGVDVELDGSSWAVKNVGAGSFGSSVGIKPGDRVEAIDGKPVDRNTTFTGAFKARVITVRRDGNLIELKP